MTHRSSMDRSRRSLSLSPMIVLIIVVALLLLDWLGVMDVDNLLGGHGPVVENPTGTWYQVYFTSPRYPDQPEDHHGGLDEKLAAAIAQAQSTIDIAVYKLDLDTVTEALIAAHKRGVRVRLVTDTEYVDEMAIRRLKSAGIPVVDDRRNSLMHDKFVVIDGNVVWTGSWNFTINGTYRNNNGVIVITSPALAENYITEFEEMFKKHSFGPDSPANTPHPRVVIGDTAIENYFAPEDGVAEHLIALINGAQHSVRFMVYSFTSDEIGEAILRQARRGVQVQGVIEGRGTESEYGEYDKFRQARLDVRLDGNPYFMHHKVLIIDEQTVALGSYNFTANAEKYNDENVLIIHDPDIAALYLEEFQRVYAQGQ